MASRVERLAWVASVRRFAWDECVTQRKLRFDKNEIRGENIWTAAAPSLNVVVDAWVCACAASRDAGVLAVLYEL